MDFPEEKMFVLYEHESQIYNVLIKQEWIEKKVNDKLPYKGINNKSRTLLYATHGLSFAIAGIFMIIFAIIAT